MYASDKRVQMYEQVEKKKPVDQKPPSNDRINNPLSKELSLGKDKYCVHSCSSHAAMKKKNARIS